MRRAFLAILVALGLVSSFMFSTAVAAPAQPIFSATLTEGPTACEFTAATTWRNARVDTVYIVFFMDGTDPLANHLFTVEAPGPFAGTYFKGRTAGFHTGAFPTAPEPHTFYVLVQHYYNGAQQHTMWLELTTNCTRNP